MSRILKHSILVGFFIVLSILSSCDVRKSVELFLTDHVTQTLNPGKTAQVNSKQTIDCHLNEQQISHCSIVNQHTEIVLKNTLPLFQYFIIGGLFLDEILDYSLLKHNSLQAKTTSLPYYVIYSQWMLYA